MPEKIIAGRYRIADICGRGGTSRVLQVCRLTDNRVFAAKILDPSFSLWDGQREAAILRLLTHPAIPALEECFLWENQWVLILEWRAGKTLEQCVRERRKLNAWETLCLGIGLTGVLQSMHEQVPPVLYLDMKPSNILVNRYFHLTALLDFGCARVTDDKGILRSEGIGTEGFAAPEQQLAGQAVTATADVYGLAATLRYVAADMPGRHRLKLLLEQTLSAAPLERCPSMRMFRKALFGCIPACLGQWLTAGKVLWALTAVVGMLLAGRKAARMTAENWQDQLLISLEHADATEEETWRDLERQVLWNGKTGKEMAAENPEFCREVGRKLWCLGKTASDRRESCSWLACGALSEEEGAGYRYLETYYRCLEAGERPEEQLLLAVLDSLTRMALEEEETQMLAVTAKELLKGVYMLPEESFQTDQVRDCLGKLCRKLGHVEQKALLGEVPETAEELLELSQTGRNAIE